MAGPGDTWDFYILSSASMKKKKASRKAFAASAKDGCLYPAPGHCSCIVPPDLFEEQEERDRPPSRRTRSNPPRRSKRTQASGATAAVEPDNTAEDPEAAAANANDEPEEPPKQRHTIFTVGGATRNTSDKLWQDCSRPVVSTFAVYENDVRADDMSYQTPINGKILFSS